MQKEILLFDLILDSVCKSIAKIGKRSIDDKKTIKECADNCKKLAEFIYIKPQTEFSDYEAAHTRIERGEWFVSKDFRSIITHLQLLKSLEGEDFSVEIDVLETLLAHLGNEVYYDICKLEELLECAVDLYLVAKRDNNIYAFVMNEDMTLLIHAVKILRKEGTQFEIVQGEPVMLPDSEEAVIRNIDKLIKQVGGMFFVKKLFENELMPKYNSQLGRYLIYRSKKIFWGDDKPESRIPYHYLIQLSLKHLKVKTLQTRESQMALYDKIIKIAKAYFEVLHLQGYSMFEDIFGTLTDFTFKLYKNLCFEKMYVPRQYHPDYLTMLLRNMLEPYYMHQNATIRTYSFANYVKTAEHITKTAMGPTIFYKNELKDILKISEYKLSAILNDVSIDVEQVNQNFIHYLDETNTWRKPLIRLDEEIYFCLDGRMSGYGFYEVMYQIIFCVYGASFSAEQGDLLEEMVYKMFRSKHFSFVYGRYKQIDDLPERDCDMILDNNDTTMFIEIKKCPLPTSYERGNDIQVLKSLGKGMLYAQEQIMWHKVRLKEKGKLELYDKKWRKIQDYSLRNKRVIAVSICMPEYDFLTDRHITEAFLESSLLMSYHAIDPKEEKSLEGINKTAHQIRVLVNRLYDGKTIDVRDAFFYSQFRSLQQIWTILQLCNTKEEFFDMCKNQLFVSYGSGDVYVEILNTLHIKKTT